MGKRKRTYAIGVALFAVLVWVFHWRVHFDWHSFLHQLRAVDPVRIGLGIGLIYVSVALRAVRWALLLRRAKGRVPPRTLVGPQFIGFASVALFGSLADLVRPYLIAKRVGLSLSSQMATYTVERMYDLLAAATLFLGTFAVSTYLASEADTRLPHPEVFTRVGIGSFLAAAVLCLFALGVHFFGARAAKGVERLLGGLWPAFAAKLARRVLLFREGVQTVSSLPALAGTLLLSLAIWGLVGLACVQVVHAFTHIGTLARLSFLGTMLLLAASIGGSLVQLPFVGWFTQIAATAGTMHGVLGVPLEPATACGALLLAVTFVCIIPAGLFFAHFERISMRAVVQEIGAEG